MVSEFTIQGTRNRQLSNKFEFTQLCWKCKRASGDEGGCSWQKHFEPVDGWNAEPTMINMSRKLVPSFKVFSCPLFIQDTNDKLTTYLKGGEENADRTET